ncbi:histidinol-phosphate transaminase [Rhizobium sp. RCAM05350]|nr:histidinol-phosphate transaminase [Rhizobium sp. RCAM05350]
MSKFWSPLVSRLKPYLAGEQPKMANLVKLNTNENPYGPSPAVLDAIGRAATEDLRRYPDPSALALRQAIARRYGLETDQVFAGNGSDEVLAFAFAALLKHDAPLLYPDITYSFYPTYSLLYDIETVEIPLDAQFRIRPSDYRRACGAIILPNPNAPTGTGLPLAAIEEILKDHPDQPVIVDEAYIDFGGETAVPLIAAYDNLLVVQTFSKSRSLAGLRVGFAIGQRPLVEAIERVKDSFNSYPLDAIAQAAALAAINDEGWFELLPSQANFVFARHTEQSGEALARRLREQAVIVRHFARPRIADFLRITVGTPQECSRLIEALDAIL